ncbi:MAG: carbohydrate binding domain-containing protein [Ignavibacteria bacterium]|nr:carbohydrate binding domain-containing protein [Ignavibacteria bacterium]
MNKNNFFLFLFLTITMVFFASSSSKAQPVVIEDYEYYGSTDILNKAWHVFGDVSSGLSLVVDATKKVKPEGSNYVQFTYNSTSSTVEGVAERIYPDLNFYPLDLSTAKAGLQFLLKGDGTENVLRLRYLNFYDEAGTVKAEWRSQPISLKDTAWHIVRIPFILDSTDTYGLHLFYTNNSAVLQTEEAMIAGLGNIIRFQIGLETLDKADVGSHNIYLDDFRAVDFMPPHGEGDIRIADFEEYINSKDFLIQWQGFGYGTLDIELQRTSASPEGYKNASWIIQPEERTTWGMAFHSRVATYPMPDLSSIGVNGGVKFLLKGDGTADNFVFRFQDAANNYWGSYWIPLQDTTWHWVTVPFVVDSLKGFRWLGNDPNGTYWTTNIGTIEMFRESLGKLTEIRLDKRTPLHDDVIRTLEFDSFYAVNELPALPPLSVDDFETYTDSDNLKESWNQFGAGSVALELSTTDFMSGGKAMAISYNGINDYTAVRKRNIIPGLNFADLKGGIQFWLKGDGSTSSIALRLQSGNEMWESALIPMNQEAWQHFGVCFKADSINGFRYLGNNPDNPVWSTDVGTDGQLLGDIANIDQVRFYVRNPQSVDAVKTFLIDKIEGVDRFDENAIVSVENEGSPANLVTFDLKQNYPNPFNPSTTIQYSIQKEGFVTLNVYNIIGQKVISLVNDFKKAGNYHVNFNASRLASGMYLYQLQSGSFVNTKKMILLK